MAILNANLDWSSFANSPGVQSAFRGTPVKTLIPAGRLLCRFITAESKKNGIPGNEIYLGPWWTEWSSTAKMLNDWKTSKSTPRDILRGRLAVTKAFSSHMDGMVQVALTQPVYAWKGPARYQTDKRAKVTYLGGGEQLFLPNLASDRTGVTSNVAQMHCWSWVDSLA